MLIETKEKRWTNVISDSLVLFCLHVTLPSGASELTTLWRYTNTFIIIIIVLLRYSIPRKGKKYAMQLQKVQKSTWNEPYSSSSFTIIIMYIFLNFYPRYSIDPRG